MGDTKIVQVENIEEGKFYEMGGGLRLIETDATYLSKICWVHDAGYSYQSFPSS